MSIAKSASKLFAPVLWVVDTLFGRVPAIRSNIDDELMSHQTVFWLMMPAWARLYVGLVAIGSLTFAVGHQASHGETFDVHEKIALLAFLTAFLVQCWFVFGARLQGHR